MTTKVQNRHGQWVPAIPLPLYAGRHSICKCGLRFRREPDYRGHFALVHILGLD